MTAQWLMQMGWDVVVLDRPFDGQIAGDRRPGDAAADLPDVLGIGGRRGGALAQ